MRFPTNEMELDKLALALFSRTSIVGDCFVLNGAMSKGYGVVGVTYRKGKRKQWRAHRLAYFLFVRPVGSKKMILHNCDNPACWNPNHLREGTAKENMADMSTRGRSSGQKKTNCKNGHELAGKNLIVNTRAKSRRPYRRCRACQKNYMKKYMKEYARKKYPKENLR